MPPLPPAMEGAREGGARASAGLGQAFALSALALAAWLPATIGAGFAFDDREAIEANPVVEGSLPWTAAFRQDYWEHRGAAGHFRPLATLFLRMDRALWGDHGAGFHATNVALHVLVVFLAALLARRVFARAGSWPWIGVALFAVHPVLADSVAWISGRTSMLAALPGLAAGLALARGVTPVVPACFALGFLGTGVSGLGKEDGLLWALALPYLAARHGRRAAWSTAIGCTAGAFAMLALRAWALGSPWIHAPHAPLADAALFDRLLVGGRGVLEALRLSLWPAGYAPSALGDPAFSLETARASPALGWLGLAAWCLALAVTATASLRRPTPLRIAALLVVSSWVFFLQIQPAGEVFAPRFLYLPLLFAIPLGHALLQAAFRERAALALGLIVLAALPAAWTRGRIYASRGAFREAVLALRPDDVPSWNDLGLWHEEQGRMGEARAAWLHATRLDPRYSRAWSNLGRVELLEGDLGLALEHLQRAVAEGRDNPIAHVNLGSAWLRRGDAEAAETTYRAALDLAPGLAPAWEGWTRSLVALGRMEDAREAWRSWTRLDPANPRARELGRTHFAPVGR